MFTPLFFELKRGTLCEKVRSDSVGPAHLASASAVRRRGSYAYSHTGPHTHTDSDSDAHSAPSEFHAAASWPLVSTAPKNVHQSHSCCIAPYRKDFSSFRFWQLPSTATWLPAGARLSIGSSPAGPFRQQPYDDDYKLGHVLQWNVDHAGWQIVNQWGHKGLRGTSRRRRPR